MWFLVIQLKPIKPWQHQYIYIRHPPSSKLESLKTQDIILFLEGSRIALLIIKSLNCDVYEMKRKNSYLGVIA